ncbi:TIR domain-containing protein [Lentzea sp.]|uniref:TIR domain-containing protein n=1 Tax=Lentzea sp. TaxID=56099 RepID=UPI002ED0438E
MHHIFISYSRIDVDWVTDLRAVLEERGMRTWLDLRDIPLSVPWLDEVTEAIEDAAVFMVCDSPKWHLSGPCAVESEVAAELGKPRVTVPVGGSRVDAVERAIGTLRTVPADSYLLRELHAQARTWHGAGRPSRLLASKTQRARAAACAAAAGPVERAYLGASARRAARRWTTLAVGVTITMIAALFGALLFPVQAKVEKQNLDLAVGFQHIVTAKAELEADPYAGLRTAGGLGDTESAFQAELIEQVLGKPVPDDAFRVGAVVLRFATKPIGDEVVVEDQQRHLWARAAGAVNERKAVPHDGTGALAPMPYEVALEGDVVSVRRRGALYRKVQVPDATPVFGFSPDGRWLAVGGGALTSVVDVEAGVVRRRMVGAPAAVSDLAWSADSTRLWAVAGMEVVSWRWTTGRLLVNEPGKWFQAVLPDVEAKRAWLVERHGELRQVSLDDGRTLRQLKIDEDTVIAAGGNGSKAVLLGLNANWLVRLRDGVAQRFGLPENCGPPAGVLSLNADFAVIPCDGKDVQVVSLADGSVKRAIRVAERGARAATITGRGTVVIGGTNGEVFWSDKDSDVSRVLHVNECGVSANAVLVSPAEDRIAAIGNGAAQIGCNLIGRPVDGEWEWNTNMVGPPSENRFASISLAALSGSFSPSGRGFVIGYADGSLVMQPTDALAPARTVRDVPGGVRSTLFIGDTLYLATREGVLQAIRWCDECLSNASMAREAAAIFARAEALGLT